MTFPDDKTKQTIDESLKTCKGPSLDFSSNPKLGKCLKECTYKQLACIPRENQDKPECENVGKESTKCIDDCVQEFFVKSVHEEARQLIAQNRTKTMNEDASESVDYGLPALCDHVSKSNNELIEAATDYRLKLLKILQEFKTNWVSGILKKAKHPLQMLLSFQDTIEKSVDALKECSSNAPKPSTISLEETVSLSSNDAKSDQKEDSTPREVRECATMCSQKWNEDIESVAFILRTDYLLKQLPTVVDKMKRLEEHDADIQSCFGACVCQKIHDTCQKVQDEIIKHKTMLAGTIIELKTTAITSNSDLAEATDLSDAIGLANSFLSNCLEHLSHCSSAYALDQKEAIQKTNVLVENVASVKFDPQPVAKIEQLLGSRPSNSLSDQCFKSCNNKFQQLHKTVILYATKNFEGILSDNADKEAYQQFRVASTRAKEFIETFEQYYENCMAGHGFEMNTETPSKELAGKNDDAHSDNIV